MASGSELGESMQVLKALAVMLLGALGAGTFYSGLHSTSDAAFLVGLGVFLLLGAFFLYRSMPGARG